MNSDKRLPKYVEQHPERQFEVLDLRAYTWDYIVSEEWLTVGVKTTDLSDVMSVNHYEVGFPYTQFGFDDHEENGVLEVLAEERRMIYTQEQLDALTTQEKKRYDEDRALVLGETYILLLDPGKRQHYGEE